MSAKFFYSHSGFYGSNIAGSYIVGDLCFLFRMICIIDHLETKETNLVTLLLTIFLALMDYWIPEPTEIDKFLMVEQVFEDLGGSCSL